MRNESDFFQDKKADAKRLISFGFTQNGHKYVYQCPILNQAFELTIVINETGVFTNVIDPLFNAEYCLHKISGAEGKFIGEVKMEYEQILSNIRDRCFVQNVFKSQLSIDIINYAYEKFGDELEFLWNKLPKAAVLRHKISQKWYAIFMKISARKLGIEKDNEVEILNLKTKSEDITKIIDMEKFFPAYHMNKKHWLTIYLDKISNITEILPLISESYLSVTPIKTHS